MPLFMDIHHKIDGMTPEVMAEAHKRDLAVGPKHGVRYLKYWYDPVTGRAFCLSEAPSMEAAIAVHQEAHGAVADEIFEVIEAE